MDDSYGFEGDAYWSDQLAKMMADFGALGVVEEMLDILTNGNPHQDAEEACDRRLAIELIKSCIPED